VAQNLRFSSHYPAGVKHRRYVLPQVKENVKGLPQIPIEKEVNIMTISGIGQSMSMSLLYGMQKPGASDIASKILKALDTNGDGVLSTDEIRKAGKHAKHILGADANGDGTVTLDELISGITKKMESGTMALPPMDGMQPPGVSDIVSNIIDELDTNGDGVLSAVEISKGGERAQRLLGADANGDGNVTKDELLSQITEDMKMFSKYLAGQSDQTVQNSINVTA